MNTCISPKNMQALESTFIKESGFSSLLLMEHAAFALYNAAIKYIKPQEHCLILCGKGNNGGDGYAVARLLLQAGYSCYIYAVLGPPTTSDALYNYNLLKKLYPLCPIIESTAVEIKPNTSLIIDAIFGTGFNSKLSQEMTVLFERINSNNINLLAVDIPSGLNGETGYVESISLKATESLCFHKIKPGLLLSLAPEYTGKITLVDIGIPSGFENSSYAALIDEEFYQYHRLAFSPIDHKGKRGKLLLIAGSAEMAGAALIAANSALASGIGTVTLAGIPSLIQFTQINNPLIMGFILESSKDTEQLLQSLNNFNCVLIGPGLADNEFNKGLILDILSLCLDINKPCVADAQALNILAKKPLTLGKNIVITPHPTEAARLLDTHTIEIIKDYKSSAISLFEKYNATIVLKGARSLIFDGESTAINTIGTSALAKGGSGDTLSGIIAALLARKSTAYSPFVAASLASYILSKSAIKAEEIKGISAVSALDCINFIGKSAWKNIEI